MRILNVNKFYYLKGGSERYFFELGRLLEGRGHSVIPFAMQGERNLPSEYGTYFVSPVDFRNQRGWPDRLGGTLRILYSLEARRKVRGLIRSTKPQVAHLHNIAHQLSPSILGPMKESGMRIVQTLHDYKLVCPTYRFFAHGHVCERCLGGRYFEAVRMRCNEGSRGASLVNALEMTLHHTVLHSYRAVDAFVAPSRFLAQKIVEFGIPEEKVHHLPYYLNLGEFSESPTVGDRIVFVGRLSAEKGLGTLVQAMGDVRGLPLVVVGEGPLEEDLRRQAERVAPGRIQFVGHLDGRALREAVAGARCVVVPSEWYENSPLTIYEAFAMGRPVVGSRIGGIPELVLHEKTGLLFETGSAENLSKALERLADDPRLARTLGRQARAHVETLCDPERHLARLQEAYESEAL